MSKSKEERRKMEQKGLKEFASDAPEGKVLVDFKILERLVDATERLTQTSRALQEKVDKLEKERSQTKIE